MTFSESIHVDIEGELGPECIYLFRKNTSFFYDSMMILRKNSIYCETRENVDREGLPRVVFAV